eukprot:CAMPEP_0119431324 /NCGR_PEP_ID=MMETSP1335-20130426/45696_1 /TAXON_ID=259385 /ORGANISM="Chrysoculter rhomboideus, Strain RCC1486" /LENGTH=76 /DNA_ID=CAMNT_0007457111 /DNA_START=18 /DNA_END=244 /DNA_ORIENTATION=-
MTGAHGTLIAKSAVIGSTVDKLPSHSHCPTSSSACARMDLKRGLEHGVGAADSLRAAPRAAAASAGAAEQPVGLAR